MVHRGVGMAIHGADGHVGAVTVAAPAQRFCGRESGLAEALSITVARVDADLARTGLRAFAAVAG
jgi:DNA-binding IclR family transcriptional regulator